MISADVLRDQESVVALTGAGISLAAGIPIYRAPDGSFLDEDNELWLYRDYFDAATAQWYPKFWELHDTIRAASPTRGHRALSAMVKAGIVDHIVTQNVDGLDLLAGTDKERVSEVHGIERRLSCTNFEECGFEVLTEDWLIEKGKSAPPTCPHDDQPLKPDFNLYGERYARRDVVEDGIRGKRVLEAADALLVVGTSLSIDPWRRIVFDKIEEKKPVVIVNPNPKPVDELARFLILRSTADEGLSLLQEQLVS